MTPLAYQLTEDAYVCLADNQIVFSDLRADKYSCLNRTNTQAAIRLFPDFQERDVTLLKEASAADHEQTQLVVHALADSGLLANGVTDGKAVTPVRIPIPTSSLLSDKHDSLQRCHFGHWASFLQASLKASGKLRLQSLRRTVRSVENRKRRLSNRSSKDNDQLRELVSIFHHLRPYYVREYLCRFDSLALVEFLAYYHQYPHWVFGVKNGPFGAHCWVQEGDCILNDAIDYVRRFTPIMAF